MPPSAENLSTPKCCAEHRAWLLIYQDRIGWGKTLEEAFRTQFPDRQYYHILYHAANVRDAEKHVRAQLLDLAKQFSWYEDPPKKGEFGYKQMKRVERRQLARQRLMTKDPPVVKEELRLGG